MVRFSAFGIPVTVQPWFFFGLFMIYGISGGARGGLFAALFVGVLTLIHELGHALTARRYGATSAIQLNLLVGWASYNSIKPLKRSQQIIISVAGPLSQLSFGLVGLAIVHSMYYTTAIVDSQGRLVQMSSSGSLGLDLWHGLGWAGVIISLLNLLPLWPLDGGHVVFQVLRGWVSEHLGLKIMAIYSLAAAAAIGLASSVVRKPSSSADVALRVQRSLFQPSLSKALWTQIAVFPYFVLTSSLLILVFSGLSCVQTLMAMRNRQPAVPVGSFDLRAGRTTDPAAVVAELTAWTTGTQPVMPPGWQPSPWLQAHLALNNTAGTGEMIARQALSGVASPGPWALPDPTQPQLARLVPLIPRPLAVTDKSHAFSLARVLGNFGDPAAFLELCSGVYGQFGDPEILYTASTVLARRGFDDDAMAWLHRAMTDMPNADRVLADVSFGGLRHRPDFQQLVADLQSRARVL
jgi:stage IV sporulation protein FB